MTTEPTTIVGDLFAKLEKAWGDADGAGYGVHFTDEAHFVNIYGMHVRGAAAIGHGHQAIFDSIYKGSVVQYSVADVDPVTDDCHVALVRARLDAPEGPLEGVHESILTALVVRDGDEWKIRAFQNTLVTA
jgi:uncharacterized protein (TIGR02246 family)